MVETSAPSSGPDILVEPLEQVADSPGTPEPAPTPSPVAGQPVPVPTTGHPNWANAVAESDFRFRQRYGGHVWMKHHIQSHHLAAGNLPAVD